MAFIECGDDRKVRVPPSDVVRSRSERRKNGEMVDLTNEHRAFNKKHKDSQTSRGISELHAISERSSSPNIQIFRSIDSADNSEWDFIELWKPGAPDASAGAASSSVTGQRWMEMQTVTG